ncbi:MAG: hypothetical protein NTZ09_13175 [Candidatus Hydrogenedentes bacterium]|nr:hypothetical protein [Candidatus Hydrogenedentota bacterium]
MTERRKYIIFNAGAWLATLVVGLFVMVLLREFGSKLNARREAGALLAKARTQVRAGNTSDAQRSAVNALAVSPAVAPDVMKLFGGYLLGMPVLDERLRQAFDTEKAPDTVLAQYELLAGRPEQALEPLFAPWQKPSRHRGRANSGEGSEVVQGRRRNGLNVCPY